MLRSTATSLPIGPLLVLALGRDDEPRARPGVLLRDDLDEDHHQQNPDGGHDDGDAREGVAGAGAEGAGAAGAAEGARQAAALAALDQDQQYHEQAEQDQYHGDRDDRPPHLEREEHGEFLSDEGV